MRLIEQLAMADPAFKARRRRWIARWRHAGHRCSRLDCEWCMGHRIEGTIIRSRDDGVNIVLSFGDIDLSFNSHDRHYWDLVELHRKAIKAGPRT
jgi:hypothetical protein